MFTIVLSFIGLCLCEHLFCLYVHMCVCLWVCARVSAVPTESIRGCEIPEAGDKAGYGSPDMASGSLT